MGVIWLCRRRQRSNHTFKNSKLYLENNHSMAMENCFQVVSSTARASVVHYSHSFSSPKQEKVKLPKSCKTSLVRPSAAAAAALSFSSSSARSINPRRSLSIVCKASVDQVQVVTDTTWQTLVVGSEIPVLVDFWAPWCGPCRMIAPIIDELAKEYAEKVVCYKLNTDDCPTIASHYGIRSIPTVLFFKDGEKKESVIGAVPKSTLSATIEKYLNA